MDNFERTIAELIERQERQRILAGLQAESERDGLIPATPPTILSRTGAILKSLGGFLLGAFLGAITLLINYLLFAYLLHLAI